MLEERSFHLFLIRCRFVILVLHRNFPQQVQICTRFWLVNVSLVFCCFASHSLCTLCLSDYAVPAYRLKPEKKHHHKPSKKTSMFVHMLGSVESRKNMKKKKMTTQIFRHLLLDHKQIWQRIKMKLESNIHSVEIKTNDIDFEWDTFWVAYEFCWIYDCSLKKQLLHLDPKEWQREAFHEKYPFFNALIFVLVFDYVVHNT